MRRLKFFISVFFIALSIPLAYFILLAYRGIQQAEKAELQYFATVLFDEMEGELAELILREEKRAVDAYSYYVSKNFADPESGLSRSPLSGFPEEKYILGYFQNNPDGSFQTPLIEPGKTIPDDRQEVNERLRDVNTSLNSLDITPDREAFENQQIGMRIQSPQAREKKGSNFAEKYLDVSRLQQQKARFEQEEEQQIQQVTRDQLLNIARYTSRQSLKEKPQKAEEISAQDTHAAPAEQTVELSSLEKDSFAERESPIASEEFSQDIASFDMNNLQVEVTPMESLLIENGEILIFRRIVINNQVYRQGFVIIAEELLEHLRETYFIGHPIAEFTDLRLEINEQNHLPEPVQTETTSQKKKPIFSCSRTFLRPFSFLQATITCDKLPGSTAHRNLNIMRVLIGAIILSGLFAIYQSARSVVDLSERRALFVSSVTHELKTPLTNIRMYIEMLEQGIAPNRAREEEYFQILGSESKRLSRLIDNVLEFSKLEKKQRRFNLQEGTFEEVIQEVRNIMGEKLRQEGFILNVEPDEIPPFQYDREVMVQILLNLIENSIKFGKASPVREITLNVRSEDHQIKISVADTGPGIPCAALKKVFDEFYRVESELIRTTRGTGIGLSLVKKYVTALGGTVKATNNKSSGCTITVSLPIS